MKAMIYDIKRFALHDGPGIRTTVFFKGCPLDCWWCHNPESKKPCSEKNIKTTRLEGKIYKEEEISGYEINVPDLMLEILKDRSFMEESGGGVTFSGGEPLMQYPFLFEILKTCRREGIHSAVDTSGFASEAVVTELARLTDLILFDIKHPDDDKHKLYTGVSNRKILKNLMNLHNSGVDVILRIPLVPGVNMGKTFSMMIAGLKRDYPNFREIHLLPFHNIADHKYEKFGQKNRMKGVKVPENKEIRLIEEELKVDGYKVITGG